MMAMWGRLTWEKWLILVPVAVILLSACKRLAARMIASLASQCGAEVWIEEASLAKLKKCDLRFDGSTSIRVQVDEVSLDTVKFLRVLKEVFTSPLGNKRLELPVKASNLRLVLLVKNEAVTMSKRTESSHSKYLYMCLNLFAGFFSVDIDGFSVAASVSDRIKCELSLERIQLFPNLRCLTLTNMNLHLCKASSEMKQGRILALQTETFGFSRLDVESKDSAGIWDAIKVFSSGVKFRYALNILEIPSLLGFQSLEGSDGKDFNSELFLLPQMIYISIASLDVRPFEEREDIHLQVKVKNINSTLYSRVFTSADDCKHTSQRIVDSDQITFAVNRGNEELFQLLFDSFKCNATSLNSRLQEDKSSLNIILNVRKIVGGLRGPLECDVIQQMQEKVTLVSNAMGKQESVSHDVNRSKKGIHVAVQDGLRLYMKGRRDQGLVTSLAHISLTMKLRREGFHCSTDASKFGLSVLPEMKESTNFLGISDRHTVMVASIDDTRVICKGIDNCSSPTCTLDLDAASCKLQVGSDCGILVETFDEHISPWMLSSRTLQKSTRSREQQDTGLKMETTTRIRMSKISLHHTRIAATPCEISSESCLAYHIMGQADLVSVNVFQNVLNLHSTVFDLYANQVVNPKTALSVDADVDGMLRIARVDDMTFNTSILNEASPRSVHKIWCSGLDGFLDSDSLLQLMETAVAVTSASDLILSMDIVQQSKTSDERSSRHEPEVDISVNGLNVAFQTCGNTTLQISGSKIEVESTGKCVAGSMEVALNNEEVCTAKALSIIRGKGENIAQYAVRSKYFLAKLPDNLYAGDAIQDIGLSIDCLKKLLVSSNVMSGSGDEKRNFSQDIFVSVILEEWGMNIENSNFEAWISSHWRPLQECRFGVYLLDKLGRGKEEGSLSDATANNLDVDALYSSVVQNYMEKCKEMDNACPSPGKNAFCVVGRGADLSVRVDRRNDHDIHNFIKEADENSKHVTFDVLKMLGINCSFQSVVANFAGFSYPFMDLSSLQVIGDCALARQRALYYPEHDREVKFGRHRAVILEGPVPGSVPPMKAYTALDVRINSLAGTYSVEIEPQIAHIARSFKRLSPVKQSNPQQQHFKWWDDLRYFWRGKCNISVSSFKATVLADTSVGELLGDRNQFRVSMSNFKIAVVTNKLSLESSNFDVEASFNLTTGTALASEASYQNIRIFNSPRMELGVAFEWECPNGHNPNDHHLFPLEKSGNFEPPSAVDIFKGKALSLDMKFQFSSTKSHALPTAFAGEKTVKCLAHVIRLIKDPPHALRESFNMRPFGSVIQVSSEGGLPSIFNQVNIKICSTPLRLRHCETLPTVYDNLLILDTKEYELSMRFLYLEVRRKRRNANPRRAGRLSYLHISGKHLVLRLQKEAEDMLVKKERVLTPVDEKIAALLGSQQKQAKEKTDSLILKMEEVTVLNEKSKAFLLKKAPFLVKIIGLKGMISCFKRDMLYSCVQSVASSISDVLDEVSDSDDEIEDEVGEDTVLSTSWDHSLSGKSPNASQQDLLTMLLYKDVRSPVRSSKRVSESSRGLQPNYVIEAIMPQLYLEAISADGRLLISATKVVVNGFKKDEEDEKLPNQKTEMHLESLQIHVCQLDVDPSANAQWLTHTESNDSVLTAENKALLNSVFQPCSINVNIRQKGKSQEVGINLPLIAIALDSREFDITTDVISRIVLSPMPKITEKGTLSVLGLDMLQITKLNRFATSDELQTYNRLTQEALEEWSAVMHHISNKSVELKEGSATKAMRDALRCDLQTEIFQTRFKRRLGERKELVKSLLKIEKQVRSSNHSQSKIMLKLDELRWSLCQDRREFLKAILKKVEFFRIRYEDFSGVTKFVVKDATCSAVVKDKSTDNTTSYEVLRLWHLSDSFASAPFVHVYLEASGESNGLSYFDLCDISLHPLHIHLAQKTASAIQSYFFKRKLTAEERHSMWTQVATPPRRSKDGGNTPSGSTSKAAEISIEQFFEEEGQAGYKTLAIRSPQLEHRRSVSCDGQMDDIVKSFHKKSLSLDVLDMDAASLGEHGPGMLELLNLGIQISPRSEESLVSPKNSFGEKRGIVLKRTRFNELGLKLSFESIVLNVSDMKLFLDTLNYLHYSGTWGDLMEKFKWDILKSVLKNVAGLQAGKIRGIGNLGKKAADHISLSAPRPKSLLQSIFWKAGNKVKGDEQGGDVMADSEGTSGSGRSHGSELTKSSEEKRLRKGKLLMGKHYKKNAE